VTITVVGAGAIGGFVGARLLAAGHDVRFVEADREHVLAMRANGLRITGAASIHVHPVAVLPAELEEELGLVLLAVKARDTPAALEPVVPRLSQEGCVVSLQNREPSSTAARARSTSASSTASGAHASKG
jgi:ketopantoate reductase